MTFQQHTTYEQSVRLKELGFDMRLDPSSPGGMRFAGGWIGSDYAHRFFFYGDKESVGCTGDEGESVYASKIGLVRAISRQEIEDLIRQDYLMLILPFESVRVGFGYDKVERVRVDLWERSFIAAYNEDETIAVGCIASFTCEGSDPFPALYDALCWTLERERNEKAA